MIQTGAIFRFPADRAERPLIRNLVWDEDACVHCGACAGQCPSGAFHVEEETRKVVFEHDKCIACELCIPACSYGAVQSVSDHLKRTGEL